MNQSVLKKILVLAVIVVIFGLLSSKQTIAGEADTANTSSQGSEVQVIPTRGDALDDPSLLTNDMTETNPPGAPGTSSQGTEAQVMAKSGEPLDNFSLFADLTAAAQFYHIPGSALTPVDSTTTLVYDLMGCVHASTGAAYLLNAPLEIPDDSHIVLMRLYYDDTSASNINSWITRYDELGTTYQDLVSVSSAGTSGHGSNYGDLDHYVDTYGWSYVLNVRLNVASSTLQVCGLRVMYYPPPGCGVCLPVITRNSAP